MKFDLIVSLPGFNRHGLIAEAVTAEEVGPILESVMSTYDESHYKTDSEKHPNVVVHVHPSHWTIHERLFEKE